MPLLFLVLGELDPEDSPTPAEQQSTLPHPDRDAVSTYVGSKRCRMCHRQWHESLLDSPKGRSWDALTPAVSPEHKRAAKLDVDRDYTADTACLPCHTVGFNRPGGFAIPDPQDDRARRRAAARRGVGCESCHGPGSRFIEVMRGIRRDKRSYRDEELRAVGLRIITAETCAACHNPSAPCRTPQLADRYDVNPALRSDGEPTHHAGAHRAFRLKYRIPDKN